MVNAEKEELITTWDPKEEVLFEILLLLWFFPFLNLENEDAGLDF